MHTNPLLAPWTTPHGLPPFEAIRAEHFEPAFAAAMAEQFAEAEAIAANPAPATFANTVAAFDACGRLYARIHGVFDNLTSSCTSPALQEAERKLAAPLAAHGNRIVMHEGLFARIDTLHAARETLVLADEERRLLERVHLDFVRAGARLQGAARDRHAWIVERLAELHTAFGQNVLADEEAWALELDGEADLAGLPDYARAAAAQAARERGKPGGHVVTLQRSNLLPFLTFSTRRDLREHAWRAWTSRGEHPGPSDNRAIAAEILALREEQAKLHGHASYADYALADTMAGTPAAVDRLLGDVWTRANERLAAERDALRALQLSQGDTTPIEPWDWRFYAEQVRKLRYDVDEAALKPYFALEHMVDAAFDVAGRLFGVTFTLLPDAPAYHPDVKVYEVHDRDGTLRGVFLHDNIARPGKRSGAWMSNYRHQKRNGGAVLPIVVNNNNCARGADGEPTLLSFDDAHGLFHELGHGLHGLLSDVTFERLSGTHVLRDFVELPSQLFEHWLEEPAVLERHARHWQTGEPIAPALVARLREAEKFNQGYETVRYCASAIVDLAVHRAPDPASIDVVAFERDLLAKIGAPREAGLNHRLPHFQHVFAGGYYAAGYYVYLWAEVLDADGYDAFREAGDPFDPQVAERLKRYVYGAGNSIEPRAAYRAFRGRDATPEAMLRQRGLIEA